MAVSGLGLIVSNICVTMVRCALLLIALASSAVGMYDVLVDYYDPPSSCPDGCALWSDLASDKCNASQSAVNAKVALDLAEHYGHQG
jgi:hypothetical protein